MARTLINKLTFDKLKISKKATPTTLDSTNNMYCEYPRDNISIVITNSSTANAITITVKAKEGFDDFVLSIPASETHVISNLESAYFKQLDGSLYVNPSAATGTIFIIEDVI